MKRKMEEAKTAQRRGIKRRRQVAESDGDGGEMASFYRFKILLPNGTSVGLRLNGAAYKSENRIIPIQEFIGLVRRECCGARSRGGDVDWNRRLFFEDANANEIRYAINLANFMPQICHILKLHDGSPVPATEIYENMWDLTPDTELLRELPEEYTFETALADLIDNSLQAVWSNDKKDRRLISVEVINNDKITIFDTGPGMDASDENSIVKWGKMGASLNRSRKAQAIGGKPPYLMPFFGMFGYGGPIASMHLGRRAIVSSKTKQSRKVYTLHLEKEALLNSSDSELTWRTNGGMRDPLEDEIRKSPQASFTKVEIFGLRTKILDVYQIQCKLKDIYFPYIQCDEVSKTGRTTTSVEFQVNGVDLAEIEGGEVSVTNLLSCNGHEFVFQLHFVVKQGLKATQEANARLKCVYFPVAKGKENIEKILEKLEIEGCSIAEDYETFSRVSIRRLGRLLPEARWENLPFMEFRSNRGDKGHILKRCCQRVKCFIETDAGFNPTPSKTDLAHHNPFTIALRNFGKKTPEKEKDINIEVSRDGRQLSTLQLGKEYQNWILEMHDCYDEEIDSGDDDPIVVVGPKNKQSLKVASDVVRVHRVLTRKGTSWKYGQKIKIPKGACAGCKNNLYATIEYFLIEGFPGDAGGDARIICRPLDVEEENGCVLELHNGSASLNIRSSLSLPISVMDSGKCQAVKSVEWDSQLEKKRQKAPSMIDLLSEEHCQELEVNGALPVNGTVQAGEAPPMEIAAVVRPASYISLSTSKTLGQKYIVRENKEMYMEVKFRSKAKNHKTLDHIYSACLAPSSRKGMRGLYIFQLGCKFPDIFHKAGDYMFCFSLIGSSCKSYEKKVVVSPGCIHHVTARPPIQEKCLLPGFLVKEFFLEVFDAYSNLVTKGSQVQLHMDGLHILDDKGLLRKVDGRGCIDLSGLLKVKARFGEIVSISISFHDKEVFKQEFQISMRELRITSEVPKFCTVGTQLEEMVFEVVNSDGEVDATIHDEAEHGQPHALIIKSALSDSEDPVLYTFSHGRCIVSSLPIPPTEGKFCFIATHSCYPELQLSVEVSVVQAPKMEFEEIQSPCLDRKFLLSQDSSSQKHVENLMLSIVSREKEFEADIHKYGERIKCSERALIELNDRKAEIEQVMADLQESLGSSLCDHPNNMVTKEELMGQIESGSHFAAAVICHLSRGFSFQEQQTHLINDIVGLVALLGTVRNNKLSRILAEYLGKDQMLAVVCKSYEAATALEMYGENGEIDCKLGLHAEAAALGKSICGQFLVLCLEEIRPYMGKLEDSDPQRLLLLPNPTLPTGIVPSGFLGFAVNMISLDCDHLDTMTAAGHGLRETVLYRLFGELQVYETRDYMEKARACIKYGAVSLDGGILRENGLISLGYRNPDICFPVSKGNEMQLFPALDFKKQLDEKKAELEQTMGYIEKLARVHKRTMKKFKKKYDKYDKFVATVEPMLKESCRSNLSG